MLTKNTHNSGARGLAFGSAPPLELEQMPQLRRGQSTFFGAFLPGPGHLCEKRGLTPRVVRGDDRFGLK